MPFASFEYMIAVSASAFLLCFDILTLSPNLNSDFVVSISPCKHVEINSSFILLLFFLLLLVSFQFLNVFCCCILSILCSRISVYCVLSWSHELWAVPIFSVLLFSSFFPQHFVCFIFLFISSLHTEYSTSCCIAMASVAPACLS